MDACYNARCKIFASSVLFSPVGNVRSSRYLDLLWQVFIFCRNVYERNIELITNTYPKVSGGNMCIWNEVLSAIGLENNCHNKYAIEKKIGREIILRYITVYFKVHCILSLIVWTVSKLFCNRIPSLSLKYSSESPVIPNAERAHRSVINQQALWCYFTLCFCRTAAMRCDIRYYNKIN